MGLDPYLGISNHRTVKQKWELIDITIYFVVSPVEKRKGVHDNFLVSTLKYERNVFIASFLKTYIAEQVLDQTLLYSMFSDFLTEPISSYRMNEIRFVIVTIF